MMHAAAARDAGIPSWAANETPADWARWAAGARHWVDHDAVDAELREYRAAGFDTGPMETQLEAAHRVAGSIVDLRDYNELHRFEQRIKVAAAVRDMGPGSGICQWLGGDNYRGDPVMIEQARRANADRQRRLSQAAGQGIKFAGPIQ